MDTMCFNYSEMLTNDEQYIDFSINLYMYYVKMTSRTFGIYENKIVIYSI